MTIEEINEITERYEQQLLKTGFAAYSSRCQHVMARSYLKKGAPLTEDGVRDYVNDRPVTDTTRDSMIRELTRFVKWMTTGKLERGAAGKSGLSRPQLCSRQCIYNKFYRCTYKPGVNLPHQIHVKKCEYFTPPPKEPPKPKPIPFDWLWKKKCLYRDSHSARWT